MKLSEIPTDDLTYRRSEIVSDIGNLQSEYKAIVMRRSLTDREKMRLSNLNRLKREYDNEIQNRQMTLW